MQSTADAPGEVRSDAAECAADDAESQHQDVARTDHSGAAQQPAANAGTARRQKQSGPCTKQRFQHDFQPTLKRWHERAERFVTTWSARAQEAYSGEPHIGVRNIELVCLTLDMNGDLMITVSGLPERRLMSEVQQMGRLMQIHREQEMTQYGSLGIVPSSCRLVSSTRKRGKSPTFVDPRELAALVWNDYYRPAMAEATRTLTALNSDLEPRGALLLHVCRVLLGETMINLHDDVMRLICARATISMRENVLALTLCRSWAQTSRSGSTATATSAGPTSAATPAACSASCSSGQTACCWRIRVTCRDAPWKPSWGSGGSIMRC